MKSLTLLLALALAAALGFLAVDFTPPLLFAALGAALLVAALWRQVELLLAGSFALLVVAAGLHAWQQDQPLLSLSSLCASLAAWDLASYILLLRAIGLPADSRLVRRRILRLGGGLALGWGLGWLALFLEVGLSFGQLLGLGLFVALTLALSMLYLRQRDEAQR